MKRGELYRVYKPQGDKRQYRTFVIVSRQVLIDSGFSTLICAPIFSAGEGLSTQIPVSTDEGMKHTSWIFCDNLISLRKSELTQYIGSLSPGKISQLDRALKMALDLV